MDEERVEQSAWIVNSWRS